MTQRSVEGNEIAVSVRNLSKCYHLYDNPRDRLKQALLGGRKQYFREFWALRNVSFEVRRGEALGIIGKNGSGKSTLLQMIVGILDPSSGSVDAHGRINALLELGSGFNPDFTGRENVYLNGAILGISAEDMRTRFPQVEAFADIGDFIDRPVRTYSSGMLMRLAFATQTALDPDILIVDEALAVGDMSFQIKCFARMNQLRESGVTILFVSHSLSTVISFCDRALYLRQGRPVALGPVGDVARQYEQDSLTEKMAPRGAVAVLPSPGIQLDSTSGSRDARPFALATRHRREAFLACAAGAERHGSGTAMIHAFALLRGDASPAESISPLEEIAGSCLIRFNSGFSGAMHLSIQIVDKTGSPLAVVRDSHFEGMINAVPGTVFHGLMRFTLPFQSGVYFCRLGILLFPAGGKYSGGQFNFDHAEVADIVEHGAYFTILPFVRHPIPVPVLRESKLTLTHIVEAME